MLSPSPTSRWRAHWIWAQHAGESTNQMVLARREFSLDTAPADARLLIAANTFYRLYINGTFVGRGPARGMVFWMAFDEHDIAHLLKPGANTIAIETVGIRGPGAVICQVESGDDILLKTDDAWHAIPAPYWVAATPLTTGWDYNEISDNRAVPEGWTDRGFDDTAWPAAKVIGPAATPPYYQLEPRAIPFLTEEERLPARVLRVGETEEIEAVADPALCKNVPLKVLMEPLIDLRDCAVEGAENLLTSGAPPAVFSQKHGFSDLHAFYRHLDESDDLTTIRSGFVILDFGRLINAHFRLDVEGAAGNVIDVACGQALTADGKVMHMCYHAGEWCDYTDRVVLRDGRQTWESFCWRNFRYVMLTVRRLDKPLRLHGFRALEINHDAEPRGRFTCSDETLNKVWDATTRTMRLCFTDFYMDNPFREKGIWSGDVSVVILGAFAAFGDIPGTRHYLRMFARGQYETGHFPGRIELYPRDRARPDYVYHNMQYALRLGEYFDYGGDRRLVRDVYPALRKFALWLAGYRNEHGLIQNIPMNQWIDWAPCDLRGAPLVYNVLYYRILQNTARIARALGREDEAAEMDALAEPIPDAVQSLLWNDERGLFVDCWVDGVQSDVISEHANYTALAFGVANEAQRARILPQLANPPDDMVQVEPSYMYHPLQALFGLGEATRAMDLMRKRYGRMFRRGADTLWEEWSYLASARDANWRPRYRSHAQGASCCPSYILSTEVLGIKPIEPGFARFRVDPQHGDLAWAEGVLPTPVGDIAVRWELDGGKYVLNVTVPEGAEAEVYLPGEDQPRTVGAGQHVFEAMP